ncbi:hypothetical protein O0I10_005078 [Lichtheimia ornata]|uniref:ACB domain-containing protein n=1 Tax=Lichtheimia ornata TaxID=688661 RepID=A0AAD7V680_9FUNG|nr:uncharacterized protein O0I10_005078 [Lichtheimia ornata]KAJ8659040.1 hypothetical protein O0I10_005078 [Lichtheimia ornata]
MSTVPPHYSDRFVNKRFHKALYIVQHLSPSSSFQPTKDQKLELYALYKQAVSGNVNTQRPGIFDVVGRAKWDAWNKLHGITSLEAKHRYVEALLRVAVEAFKKPASKVQAHQIIQAFTTMQPSADNETEDETSNDESSVASTDAEERDYLLEIQRDNHKAPTSYTQNRSTPTTQLPVSPALSRSYRLRQPPPQQRRPPSVASTQSGQVSVRTAPTTRRPSTSSSTSKVHMDAARVGRPMINEEPFDPHVNPWAPPLQRYKIDDGQSMDEDNGRLMQLPSPVISANSMHHQQQQHSISLRSPHHGSSAASSMTATPTATRLPIDTSNNQLLTDQQYTSVVALGPATKRALDTLQAEIVALNERIDGLRQELTERNQARRLPNNKGNAADDGDDDDDANSEVWEGWKWVAKAALRHALVNMAMAFILFVMLYQRGSPVAYIIIGQMNKFWRAARVRLLISKILV